MTVKFLFFQFFIAFSFASCSQHSSDKPLTTSEIVPGDSLDSFNGVTVYYNGGISNNAGRNSAPDGYNLGLKWQCVEYVKRYYFEVLDHEMPDSYGNAKDFFEPTLNDGQLNPKRNLLQFSNGSESKPKVNDILILDGWIGNSYGHVGIISYVDDHHIEIIQQNVGRQARANFPMQLNKGKWRIGHPRVLGWLRRKE